MLSSSRKEIVIAIQLTNKQKKCLNIHLHLFILHYMYEKTMKSVKQNNLRGSKKPKDEMKAKPKVNLT